MCGIIGYIGKKPAQSILIEGLRRLEYRGYDSAGLCTLDKGRFQLRKKKGRIDELASLLRKEPATGASRLCRRCVLRVSACKCTQAGRLAWAA